MLTIIVRLIEVRSNREAENAIAVIAVLIIRKRKEKEGRTEREKIEHVDTKHIFAWLKDKWETGSSPTLERRSNFIAWRFKT